MNVSNLKKSFRKRTVLDDVSFSLKEGEIVGFVGKNGAGKSTTIKCIVGLLKPQDELIEVSGRNIVTQRETALRFIAAQIEDLALFETMSGRDNLRLFASLNHVSGL
ncbi:ATP-binding cassette domain-containing protein [Erysipelotrichaceae bacterium 66-17]